MMPPFVTASVPPSASKEALLNLSPSSFLLALLPMLPPIPAGGGVPSLFLPPPQLQALYNFPRLPSPRFSKEGPSFADPAFKLNFPPPCSSAPNNALTRPQS